MTTNTNASSTSLLVSNLPDASEEASLINDPLEFQTDIQNDDIDIRFLVLGSSRVGKSSIIKKICYSDHLAHFGDISKYEKIEETKGADLHIQVFTRVEDQKRLKVGI